MPPKVAPPAVDWKARLQPLFANQNITSIKLRKLQSLWAGYGSVQAMQVGFEGNAPPGNFIVKEVRPPRASGVGHDRKVASYAVEAAFYQGVAPDLLKTTNIGIPRPVYVHSDAAQSDFTFVLSDISEEYPEPAPGSLDGKELHAVLDWLATYHAAFWEQPLPEGLQQQGTYWYLDTRRDEFAQMGRSWSDLKAVAEQVDERLKRPPSPDFMTVVHGDMKNENIMFAADGSRCACYDFQYTGRGYGVRDLVYLFASSVDSDDLNAQEGRYLSYYREALLTRLAAAGRPEAGERYTHAVMLRHFELALLDYVRFMAGWGMWGSGVDWAVRRAREALPRVRQLLA